MLLTAVLVPAPTGSYSALNPETGATFLGESVEKSLANLREATEFYLEEVPLNSPGRPLLTTLQEAVNA